MFLRAAAGLSRRARPNAELDHLRLARLAFIVRLSAGKYKTIGTANVTLVARNCRRCFNEALCG